MISFSLPINNLIPENFGRLTINCLGGARPNLFLKFRLDLNLAAGEFATCMPPGRGAIWGQLSERLAEQVAWATRLLSCCCGRNTIPRNVGTAARLAHAVAMARLLLFGPYRQELQS
jgi:hypothetical protein